jgi:hypothetical protein
MFILLIVAVFGNLIQFQNKYDICNDIKFKGEKCEIQKALHDSAKK